MCVCVDSGFVCSLVFLASWLGCLGRLASGARCARVLSPSGGPPVARRCVGVDVGEVCPPPSPLVFFWGGALWRVASWLCSVRRWLSRSLVTLSPSRLPLLFRLHLRVFFLLPYPAQHGVCLRVRGVSSSGGPLLSVWCRRFSAGWSSGASLVGPVFALVWLGGLAASCGVGGRFRGRGPFSCAPPSGFFSEGGLPVPPSAFPGLVQALVGICCGQPGCCWCLRLAELCAGPMGRVGYVHAWLGGPTCRVGFWLSQLGGCARRLPGDLGYGGWPFPCPFASAVPALIFWRRFVSANRHRRCRAHGGPLPVCNRLVQPSPECAAASFG